MPANGNCPECAQPLTSDMSRRRLNLIPLFITLIVLGGAGYYTYMNFLKPVDDPRGIVTPTPGPNPTPVGAQPTPTPTTAGEARAVDKPNTDLRDSANAKARTDVIARIDQMPNLSTEQKNKLFSSVDRARGMGCVLIIPFADSKKTLDPKEASILTNAIQSPGIKRLTEDPTLVFVILGYADKKGDAKANERVSIERAESVLATMRDKANVTNVMYAVGMGGADVLNKDGGNNRLVEVWAVFP